MAIQFRGQETPGETVGLSSSGNSATIDKPAGVTTGDFLLLLASISNDDQDFFPAPGWRLRAYIPGSKALRIYTRTASASEGSDYTFLFDGLANIVNLSLIAWYSDADLPILVDAIATSSSGLEELTAHIWPGVTTRRDDAVLHCFAVFRDNISSSPDPAMTERWDQNSNLRHYLMTQSLGAAGPTGTRTATSGGAMRDKLCTVAVAEVQTTALIGNTTILVDEWSFGSQSNRAELSAGNNPYEITPVNSSAHKFTTLRGDASLRHAGFFCGAGAGYLAREMYDRLQPPATVHAAVLFGSRQLTCPGYVLPYSHNRAFNIAAPAKSVITVEGEWAQGYRSLKRGLRIFAGLLYIEGEQPDVDFGASGTAGGFAYLFAQTVEGNPGAALVAIEADDSGLFVSPTTVGTFEIDDVGAYEIELDATIGRYIRASLTDLDGATVIECHIIVSVRGVTY